MQGIVEFDNKNDRIITIEIQQYHGDERKFKKVGTYNSGTNQVELSVDRLRFATPDGTSPNIYWKRVNQHNDYTIHYIVITFIIVVAMVIVVPLLLHRRRWVVASYSFRFLLF